MGHLVWIHYKATSLKWLLAAGPPLSRAFRAGLAVATATFVLYSALLVRQDAINSQLVTFQAHTRIARGLQVSQTSHNVTTFHNANNSHQDSRNSSADVTEDQQEVLYLTPEEAQRAYPKTPDADKEKLLELTRVFTGLLEKHNISYFMYGGTLLGSWRHHGLIPWDDDIDLIVNYKDIPKLRKVLYKAPSKFTVSTNVEQRQKHSCRWKFFYRDGSIIKPYTWSYPFLDVSFYKESGQSVRDADVAFSHDYSFPSRHVFPLVRRPFEGLLLPAPRNTDWFLRHTYDIDECTSQIYSHKREAFMKNTTTYPCISLHNVHPFVRSRQRLWDGRTNETLWVGGTPLSSIVL